MDIRTVGVIGAGQMGSGIAQVFAVAGFAVVLTDISEDALALPRATVDQRTWPARWRRRG
jgi:3-hydroxybutyryl-CoA dehydrogenase